MCRLSLRIVVRTGAMCRLGLRTGLLELGLFADWVALTGVL
jgi:hypothetical protein